MSELSAVSSVVLEIFYWWVAWTAFDKAHDLSGRIYKQLLPDDPSKDKGLRRPTNRDLAFGLFLSSRAKTEFIPPSDWTHKPPDVPLADGTKTYEHEFEVLRSISSFLGQAPITWNESQEPWLAHANASQVLLASGSSNKGTRAVIGTPADPHFSPKIGGSQINLRYSIGMGTETASRLQYGEYIERNRHAILRNDNKIILQAEKLNGQQVDDYLLVTRLPGAMPDTVLTVLAGLHGPGTRSAELLFNAIPPRDLEELASSIDYKPGDVPHFQAVFRASGFCEDVAAGSHIPTRLELVTEGCPPIRL
jgi:hypothetical protein